jgi:uncharacterized membrane protein
MNVLRTVSLLAATLTMGLVTGAFALYAHAIMPGLKTTDDRTFVAAFQAIDRAIINPWFMLTGFLGALVFTGGAALLHLGRDPLLWIVVALVAYIVVFAITAAVNVPLNDALKAAGSADPASAREAFDEARWAAWNLVRVVLSVGAFVALCWALVVHDRT